MYPGTWARTRPDHPATIMSGGPLDGRVQTYGELDERSIRLARVFAETGLGPGDHVAVVLENRPEVFEAYWAAVRSGLVVTAVNSHLTPAEVAYIVDDCAARVLVVSANLPGIGEGIVADTSGVRRRLAVGGEIPGHEDYEAALAAVSADPLPDEPAGMDMLYSSGTTGRPKGITRDLPQRKVHEPGDAMLEVFAPVYGWDSDTVYYSPAPQYHSAPLRFGAMTHATGGTLVVAERFRPEQALADIERHRVTHSQWVPTMFVRLLKLDPEVRSRYDLSSLKVAVHAAAPCPVEVKRRMIDWWGPVLQEYYSSTESPGQTRITSEEWLAHPGSVGRATVGILHICGEDGTELGPNEVGTVYFESPNPLFVYHNDAAKTADSRHPRHPDWATTGDLGYVDEDGWLHLTDRQAFMIISGGVNIYPQEIEDALALHPAVQDVGVIGVPDEEMGEQVKAVVETAEGATPGPELEQEILEFVRGRIAHYKCPRTVDFVAELPRTPTGKLVKRRILERYR
ncbi:acyl-CoA synthetase [Pseudonocardia sp. WMMC193]|uniref:acyl-CoA synthetase n=1 Tax=Pseudonocardia sp. WMMC193 TaxID=2911965 RepID=UPI0027E04583|nr:acyl-CoA synthetase [Pseudonocardia sp. WMMC193]